MHVDDLNTELSGYFLVESASGLTDFRSVGEAVGVDAWGVKGGVQKMK